MKPFILFLLILLSSCSGAQQQSFDITNFTAPKGWKKETSESVVQFSKEDAAKGSYCIIMLMKSIPATENSKENFDASWETVVKEMVKVDSKAEMQPSSKEDGWEIQSGHATFENEGQKGIALLVTASGYSKMVNLLVLTNTDTYEQDMTAFIESISFKKQTSTNTKPASNLANNTEQTTAKKDGYTYTTTNFDDGWNSTVQEDWVEVTKGNIKVFLHYPKEGTVFPADPGPMTNAAWDILVAPRYSNLKNYRTSYISSYVRGYLATGNATYNATGKTVFIFFFRRNNGWIECMTPDKNSFIQEFKFDPETINYNSESDVAESVDVMARRNKFAVAAADLNGTGIWTNSFANNTYYTNIYTGNSAGMSTYTSGQDYTFLPGQKFKWSLVAANSYGGKTDFAQGKGEGTWKMNNNWEIWFSNMEGKPKRYNVFFSCIKGTRLLNMLDAEYPGSGIYTTFGKKM